jgi:hypothetical protein
VQRRKGESAKFALDVLGRWLASLPTVAAGMAHTLALADGDGRLLAFGQGVAGQLGHLSEVGGPAGIRLL